MIQLDLNLPIAIGDRVLKNENCVAFLNDTKEDSLCVEISVC